MGGCVECLHGFSIVPPPHCTATAGMVVLVPTVSVHRSSRGGLTGAGAVCEYLPPRLLIPPGHGWMTWILEFFRGMFRHLFQYRREDRSDFALVTERWQALADRIEQERDSVQKELTKLRKDFIDIQNRLDECDRERDILEARTRTLEAETRKLKEDLATRRKNEP